ncbi:MAG: retropepsin-like domain-containing protein [Sedimentisphaerales bacterium]|nr:retropepsin-like domain-containing protein [Sedimentisphaerales bacterium]
MKTTHRVRPAGRYSLILAILLIVTVSAQAAREQWQRQEVDWQAGAGRRIKSIRYPKDRPVSTTPGRRLHSRTVPIKKDALRTPLAQAAETAPDALYVDAPPVAGFVPWIAVSVTKQRRPDLEFEADVEPGVRGSYPTGVNPQTDYIIGLFDTGASAHVMGYADAVRAGLYRSSLVGSNESIISGVTGSVMAYVSLPLGIFVDGTGAIDPQTLALDRSTMKGESNVAIMVGQNPGALPDLPTAIGSPLSVYYTTVIRNDRIHTLDRDGQQFAGPQITLHDADDPQAPSFPDVIPLELRPLGGVSVQYFPTVDLGLGGLGDLGNIDFDDILGGGFGTSDFPPASPSVIIGNSSQSLFFVHSVDLREADKAALDKNRFMLDTGAQITVIGSRIAARLGLNPAHAEFEEEIVGVTGDAIMAPGFYVDSLEIPALGRWLKATEVPVILLDVSSPEGGTLDGIIGMNLFVDFNIIVRGGGLFLQDDPTLELQPLGLLPE